MMVKTQPTGEVTICSDPQYDGITPALRSKSGNCSAATAELSVACTAVCVGVSVSPV